MRIQGIIPPVVTPMQANEDLDLPRLKWFIDHLITSGVHGIFVLGTNSEFYALDEREKQEVIETAAKLAEVPNILGIKDSSGDLQNTVEMIRVVPERFSVMMGRDTLIFSALMFGARGAVPATGNIAPALLVKIYELFRKGDVEGSKAAQLQLNPLRLALGLCTPPGAVKAALNLLGANVGPCRSPVAALAPEKEPLMRKALAQAGLL